MYLASLGLMIVIVFIIWVFAVIAACVKKRFGKDTEILEEK
jgi:hypothetical protein